MTSTNIPVDNHQPMLFDESDFYSAAIKRQIRLLHQSINSGTSLSNVLNETGMSYDHFIYINNNRPSIKNNNFYTLNDLRKEHHNVPVVSFFLEQVDLI